MLDKSRRRRRRVPGREFPETAGAQGFAIAWRTAPSLTLTGRFILKLNLPRLQFREFGVTTSFFD
jgi:hypothetical protein